MVFFDCLMAGAVAHKHWLIAVVGLLSRGPRPRRCFYACLYVRSRLCRYFCVHLSVHLSASVINRLFIRQMEGDGRKLHHEANQIARVGGKDVSDPNQLQWVTRAQLIHRSWHDLGLNRCDSTTNWLHWLTLQFCTGPWFSSWLWLMATCFSVTYTM